MAALALRLRFADDTAAIKQWEILGDALPDWINNCARKRDGASHVMLIRDCAESDVGSCVAWCESQGGVTAVEPISEREFWQAPSNAV